MKIKTFDIIRDYKMFRLKHDSGFVLSINNIPYKYYSRFNGDTDPLVWAQRVTDRLGVDVSTFKTHNGYIIQEKDIPIPTHFRIDKAEKLRCRCFLGDAIVQYGFWLYKPEKIKPLIYQRFLSYIKK